MARPSSAVDVLDDFRYQFIEDVDAHSVVWELLHKNIISDGDQRMILGTADRRDQNEILHFRLQRTCTNEALMEVCDIIVAVMGNPKMRHLGEAMKRRLQTSSPFSASQILKTYEDEFLDVVNAKQSLLKLKRKGVISQAVKASIEATKDDEDAKYLLLEHLEKNATVDTLREYCRIAIAADGYPRMQALGWKMMMTLPPEESSGEKERVGLRVAMVDQPEDQFVSVNGTLLLTCNVSGSEPISYQWLKDGEQLQDDGRVSGSNASVLMVDPVEGDDFGGYRCNASNDVNQVLSEVAMVAVAPVIVNLTASPSMGVPQGIPLNLTCEAVGGPTLNVTWTTPTGPRVGRFISIDSVTADDAGEYTCEVTSEAGTTNDSIAIRDLPQNDDSILSQRVHATLVQVIQDDAEKFLEEMNSTVLVPHLKALGLIPAIVETNVLQSKSREGANAYLLLHLKENADMKSVMKIFRIASQEPGYGIMNTFADGVLKKLQRAFPTSRRPQPSLQPPLRTCDQAPVNSSKNNPLYRVLMECSELLGGTGLCVCVGVCVFACVLFWILLALQN